jgi:hypothetical protein
MRVFLEGSMIFQLFPYRAPWNLLALRSISHLEASRKLDVVIPGNTAHARDLLIT